MKSIQVHVHKSYWRNPRAGVYVAGAVFDGPSLLDDERLINQVAEANNPDKLVRKVASWHGFFALVIEGPFGVFFAVDQIRSIPLFYGANDRVVYVSSEAGWVRRNVGDTERDPLAVQEFQLTGYVTGTETLFANVHQLQAGEALFTRRLGDHMLPERVRYARFIRCPRERSEANLLEELDAATEASIDRLVTYANGRPIVIPLSGGLDSRIIATVLSERGYPDVRCFTYGRPGNTEAVVSRDVATRLGLDWHFVPYTVESWRQLGATTAFQQYLALGHQHTSIAHVQDWPAVKQMTEEGVIPPESVVVPGHSGDFTAGSHTLHAFLNVSEICAGDLADTILERHYRLWSMPTGPSVRRALHARVLNRLGLAPNSQLSGEAAIAAHDTWNWQERQAKFIVNSVRAYESTGHQWWIPLWDADLMAFWGSVPLEWRIGTRLHHRHVGQRFRSVRTMAKASNTNPDTPWRLRRNPISRAVTSVAKSSALWPLTQALLSWHRGRTAFNAHPLAWYGLLDKAELQRLHGGTQDINSFIGKRLTQLSAEELEIKTR